MIFHCAIFPFHQNIKKHKIRYKKPTGLHVAAPKRNTPFYFHLLFSSINPSDLQLKLPNDNTNNWVYSINLPLYFGN